MTTTEPVADELDETITHRPTTLTWQRRGTYASARHGGYHLGVAYSPDHEGWTWILNYHNRLVAIGDIPSTTSADAMTLAELATTTHAHTTPKIGQRVQIKPRTYVGAELVGGYVGMVTAIETADNGTAVEVTDTRLDHTQRHLPVWVLADRTTLLEV